MATKKGKLLAIADLPRNKTAAVQSRLTAEQYQEFQDLIQELAVTHPGERPTYTALSKHIQAVFGVHIKPDTISEHVRKKEQEAKSS